MTPAVRVRLIEKALAKLAASIRDVRRLGYHSIADEIARERETLRTLTKAEERDG